ncbi:MAG: hypothetical protein Q8O34_17245 [Rhodocyclaceae bacterium]|nr:hypothetical protein [Rhodocyclaceae bacterium]
MNVLLLTLGRIGGFGGALLCAIVFLLRVSGNYWIAGFQVGTLFMASIAAMVFGCVCFLAYLTQGPRKSD